MAEALEVDPGDFYQLFHETDSDRMRGVFGTIEETFRTMAIRLGATPTDHQIRFAMVSWNRLHHKLIWPSPETLSTLDALRGKRLKLGLVSNCSEETALMWPRQPMSTRFRAAIFSSDVGLLKPDPRIYKLACEDLRVKPENCVFVGDNADEELAGAQALGMRAIQTVEHRDGPPWTGETIKKISDLTNLLE
jgi:putative hydrolase of the HAD superfamily